MAITKTTTTKTATTKSTATIKNVSEEKAVKSASSSSSSNVDGNIKLAAVLVRGPARIEQSILDTVVMLRLTQKNHCVVVNNTPSIVGMLKKVKDFITWGEITAETYDQLVHKRGVPFKGQLMDRHEKYSYKVMDYKGKKYLPYFSLNPPVKGFGRKGTKMAFAAKGALGYRGEKMNDLIQRML